MNVTARSFECLACGKSLEFTAGQIAVRCTMCEDDRPLPLRFPADVAAAPIEASAAASGGLPGHVHARCRSCATLFSAATPPSQCPLCGGDTAPEAVTEALLPVHGWLPFLVDEHPARALLTAELARLGIASAPVRFTGIHLPWLVYACIVKAKYDGRRGDLEQHGRHSRMVWRPVSGSIEHPFENRRASASRTIVGDDVDRLEPWDWAFAEPLAPPMPLCERSELPVDGIVTRTMPMFDTEVGSEARYDIGGDAQEVNRVTWTRTAECFRQILLPVWIGTLATGARVSVNGRTGEVIAAGQRSLAVEDSELVPSNANNERIMMYAGIGVFALVAVFVFLWV